MSEENRPGSAAPASAPGSQPVPPAPPAAAPPRPAPRKSRRIVRRTLLTLGPVAVLVVGGYFYFMSGRFIDTDNAYIKADLAIVAAQVAGPISNLAVHENQRVKQGDILFTVDDRAFKVTLEQNRAQLAAMNDLVESFRAGYRQTTAQLALARTTATYQQREYERLAELAKRKLISDVAVDDARQKRDVANQDIQVTERALEAARARLGGSPDKPLTDQAAYQAAKSMYDKATLDLEHTIVRAPFDGIASKVPTVGQYVAPGAPIMSIVSDHDMWIEANYKETELTHVTPGQPVDIELDTYPGRTWRGSVESISQATGAEFSVIPAQNATGNWVKVAQRIPVRIAVQTNSNDPELRVGMSAVVTIDTGYERPAPAIVRALLPKRPAPRLVQSVSSARD